jgi:hypothetical protein
MKKPITVFATLIAAHFLLPVYANAASSWNCKPGSFGTGPGSLKVEERAVAGTFKGIAVRNAACVEFVQGPTVNIKVEGSAEALEQLEVAIERESLVIGEKRGSWNGWYSWGKTPIRVLVTAPSIEALAVAGSGDLYSAKVDVERIKVSVAGSGDIMLQNLSAKSVTASVAGSGDVRLAGKVQSAKFSVAGSGDIDTTRLETAQASISVAGSGDAKVWVTGALAVSVAGSGTVSYFGTPQVSSRTAGSGTVKRLGDRP